MNFDMDSKKNYETTAKKLQVSFYDENAACSNNQNVVDKLEKNKEMREKCG